MNSNNNAEEEAVAWMLTFASGRSETTMDKSLADTMREGGFRVDSLYTHLSDPSATERMRAPEEADLIAAAEKFRDWYFRHVGKRIYHANARKAVDMIVRAALGEA